MPVDGSSARKVPESGSAESVPVRLASIDRQLSAVREILDRVEHALGEVVRIDPDLGAFRNINTPEEYYRFRDGE